MESINVLDTVELPTKKTRTVTPSKLAWMVAAIIAIAGIILLYRAIDPDFDTAAELTEFSESLK